MTEASDAQSVILGKTVASQHRASNPESSAWVSANAGSGKTFVLAQRVVRLLLSGVAPSKILCLTFTKAAAAEMSNRVFELLSEWSTMDDASLASELQKAGEMHPGPAKLNMARTLFTRALESPGGLKVQTIHAFCEALLHQFTLEANTSGHFEVMGEYEQKLLLSDARQAVMAATYDQPELAEALARAMQYGSDTAIEKGLESIIGERQQFAEWVSHHHVSVNNAVMELGNHLGVDINMPQDELKKILFESLPITDEELFQVGQIASQLPEAECGRISRIIIKYRQSNSIVEKFDLRFSLFQTKAGAFRDKKRGRKSLFEKHPECEELFAEELDCLVSAFDHLQNWKMLKGSLGLFILGDAVLQSYGQRKRSRGFLDYDDLVNRAADLLARSNVRQWVQYKLDQGIDHVLVDEAQDTNRVQWQIINAIIEEFFAGHSAHDPERKQARTVFAVGDEKQSIYSFQGAEPEMFDRQKTVLRQKAIDANMHFEDVKLDLSFRSTRDVLSAVDKVFVDPQNSKGLQNNDEPVIHEPNRQSDPGEVLIWPLIEPQKDNDQEDWLAPVDQVNDKHPAVRLAERIARTIKGWIDQHEMLEGKGRKITHGDILILVRERGLIAGALTRELKRAGLNVAGSDRLNLTSHIAIEDLLSLAKWALFPEDDLSLAEVLKSPLFDFSEDDLFEISVERGQKTLWQSLRGHCKSSGSCRLSTAKDQLSVLLRNAPTIPSFEFFSQVLSGGNGRKKFKARLGDEVDDVLDAFLLEALNHSSNGGCGLQDFIHSLEIASPDIKREIDLQRDEIRVMSVHSAKGLEAPIVFLIDSGRSAFNAQKQSGVMKTKADGPFAAFLWRPAKKNETEHTRAINLKLKEKAEEEYRRLLYVGMTRAEDRLVICGFGKASKPDNPTWHRMVGDSLIEGSEEIITDGEVSAWRWTKAHELRKPCEEVVDDEVTPAIVSELPTWIYAAPKTEAVISPPLSPSVAALSIESRSRLQDVDNNATAPLVDGFALQRGNATHHLLQFLPRLEPSARAKRAASYLAQTFNDWSDNQQAGVCRDVMNILEHEEFSHLFCDDSQAEVSLTGVLDIRGHSRQISGQIDRIALFDNKVLIVDYKTDRFVPGSIEQISDQYLVQLAIYKKLVEQIYPDKTIECALLWTSTPQIMVIGDDLLSARFANWTNTLTASG
ncbi:MAG: double-strand break repair helicase AddA [Rhizobiaceae bacterium]|nr:double-strand break repair helicase AddA [Rhizobiaceae bacterium]